MLCGFTQGSHQEDGTMKKHAKLGLVVCAVATLALGLKYEAAEAHPHINSVMKKFAAMITPRSVFAQSSTVLWKADMESNGDPGPDLSQWCSPGYCDDPSSGGGVYSNGIASASPSFDFAHSGLYSAMLKINTANTTSIPTSGTRLFRWLEPRMNNNNSNLYYSVWYYFPQLYTPNGTPAWWNVLQWKSEHVVGGVTQSDPMFTLQVGETTYNNQAVMYFYLCPPSFVNGGNCYPQTPPYTFIPVGQWTQVEAYYLCAGDNTGHVTFWEDGVQLFDVSAPTRYADGDCQWSVNNYSGSLNPPTATIYVDDAAICAGGRCPWPLP
jgi:hypothetical protein